MRRPFRLRRIAKWTGVGICTFIAVVWLLSGWWYVLSIHRSGFVLGIQAGRMFYTQDSRPPMLHFLRDERHKLKFGFRSGVPTPIWVWTPESRRVLYFDAPIGSRHTAFVPCWVPFLFVVFPTAILWYLDRRRIPPGHCRNCGYDLTGNTSGRCPECGRGT